MEDGTLPLEVMSVHSFGHKVINMKATAVYPRDFGWLKSLDAVMMLSMAQEGNTTVPEASKGRWSINELYARMTFCPKQ